MGQRALWLTFNREGLTRVTQIEEACQGIRLRHELRIITRLNLRVALVGESQSQKFHLKGINRQCKGEQNRLELRMHVLNLKCVRRVFGKCVNKKLKQNLEAHLFQIQNCKDLQPPLNRYRKVIKKIPVN